jgi:hypothetical protein
MVKRRGRIVGTAAVGLLLLVGCENIPYYDESLGWFSWSDYDPEVKAIEAGTPPPGALEAPAAPDDRVALAGDGRSGYYNAGPRQGATVSRGATPPASKSAIGAAGNARLTQSPGSGPADPGSPLVGTRSSVGGSVTWRSPRGTP